MNLRQSEPNTAEFARSGVQVSRIGFGAMGLGGSFGRHARAELVDAVLHSLERGVNVIDTARVYGPSEELIGEALRRWAGPRPFVATKAASRNSLGWATAVPVRSAYPPGAVTESVTASLKALGVETIDLIQLHQYWPAWDADDYWLEELAQLKASGRVRFAGLSLPDHRHDLATHIVQTGLIDSVQTIVNIFDPLALDSLVPLCRDAGVAVIARCVLDEGGLTGFLAPETAFADGDFRHGYFDAVPRGQYLERVERLKRFVPREARSLTELAIRFVLSHPGVTTAVISMHIPDCADENIEAASLPPLPGDVFEELRRHHRWVRNFYETHYW